MNQVFHVLWLTEYAARLILGYSVCRDLLKFVQMIWALLHLFAMHAKSYPILIFIVRFVEVE